ncbi:hypothetical protein CC1G_07339 [Coprinopsis cinerea okayama7|uniref:Uncharacterized protein n=1 Tax=Coprinopsis cinerea (strain Okayama-7 / 130 / ATCC MYA-4618 / FGSC 9003) TaxID=240176 RepID=A8NNT3_COPC7|nr:hypothetical protein CC1G_07339 [Coprinopsis cinerea okayama7\|eukprot:XP_001835197.1 hypothetical protein CC1G_07339 [Coprinopsis cinerea okayama7\
MGQANSVVSSAVDSAISEFKENILKWATPRTTRFVPTEQDVLAVEGYLLPYLPIEVINIILDEAEYWPHLICSRESDPPRRVIASASPDHNMSVCYLISPKISEYCLTRRTKLKVRRIVFHTLSHDQGWGGDAGLTGLYEGSYTWFEAAIFRNLEGNDDSDPDEIARSVQSLENRGSDFSRPFQVSNPDTGKKVWLLQKNVRASHDEVMHEIVWDGKDVPREADGLTSEEEATSEKGSGLGYGFVRQLQAGDHIAIFARAQYPGWTNHVVGVDMQIFYSM